MADEAEKRDPEEIAEEKSAEIKAEPEKAAPKKRGRTKKAKKATEAKKEKKEEQPIDKEILQKKQIEKLNKVVLFNRKYLKNDIPVFKAGDTLRIHYLIVEGDKTRIQVFEGVCIARKHGGLNETIKVRKMSGSVGVERTFFLHSKRIEKIEVKKVGHIRRAKIYFLRGRTGKAARIREMSLH